MSAGDFGRMAECIDCGCLVDVGDDFDEPAVCFACVRSRRNAERRARSGATGALHIARERGLVRDMGDVSDRIAERVRS